MGANISTPETQNPNPSLTPAPHSLSSPPSPTMSSDTPNPDPKSSENQNPDPKSSETQNPERDSQSLTPDEKGEERESNPGEGGEGEEEEGEGECGFCLFMKGGGCKDAFVAWEECVEQAEKNKEDLVDKCAEVTRNLKTCMDAHSDYYAPILSAEKAAEEEVRKEMEIVNEGEKGASGSSSSEDVVEGNAEIVVQQEEEKS